MGSLFLVCLLTLTAVLASKEVESNTLPLLPPDLALLKHIYNRGVRQHGLHRGRAASGINPSHGATTPDGIRRAEANEEEEESQSACSAGQCQNWHRRYQCSVNIATFTTTMFSTEDSPCISLVNTDALMQDSVPDADCFTELWVPLSVLKAASDGEWTARGRPRRLSLHVDERLYAYTVDNTTMAHNTSEECIWVVLNATAGIRSASDLKICTGESGVAVTDIPTARMRGRLHHFKHCHSMAKTSFIVAGSRHAKGLDALARELRETGSTAYKAHRAKRSQSTENTMDGETTEPHRPAATTKPLTRKEQNRLRRQRLREERRRNASRAAQSTTTSPQTTSITSQEAQPPVEQTLPTAHSNRFCHLGEEVSVAFQDFGWSAVLEPSHLPIRNCRGRCSNVDPSYSNDPLSTFSGYTTFALLKMDIMGASGSPMLGLPRDLSICCVPTKFTDFTMLLYVPPQKEVALGNMTGVISPMDSSMGMYQLVLLPHMLPTTCGCA